MSQEKTHIFEISNDNSAWEALKSINSLPDDASVKVVFDKWPVFDLIIEGDGFKSSLDRASMQAISDFHDDIMRACASIIHGKGDLRSLSNEISEHFSSIKYTIADGCSHATSLYDMVIEIVRILADKVSAKEISIIVIVLGLAWFGTDMYKSHLESEAQLKQIDLKIIENNNATMTTTQNATISSEQQAQRELQSHEEKIALMNMVANSNPKVKATIDESKDAKLGMLKAAKGASSISYAGVEIPADQALSIAKSERKKSSSTQLNDDYRVIAYNAKDPTDIKITIKSSTREFTASLSDSVLTPQSIGEITQSLSSKSKTVKLNVNARIKSGEVIQAEVVGVVINEET
jgi:plasmid maintenance system killer protein